jgi:acetyl esterase
VRGRRPGDGDDRGAAPLIDGLDDAAIAESRVFTEELTRLLADEPPVYAVPPEASRRARREGRGPLPPPEFLPQARDLSIPTRSGERRLRVLAPEQEAAGLYLHFHGGGWVFGCYDEQDARLWELVKGTDLCAVSFDYRLAPEHPFPAAPDDCEDAAVWLLDGGLRELGAPDRITIGGESAGAHLSVLTLLRLRDRHGVTGAFRAANLVYGAFDLSMTPSARQFGDRPGFLTTEEMRWFGMSFIGDRKETELRDPELSPLFADLRDLPPALFTVGEHDPLLDDSLFMAARWQAAGNRAELRVWPESTHGFTAFPIALARAANATVFAFLREAVAD